MPMGAKQKRPLGVFIQTLNNMFYKFLYYRECGNDPISEFDCTELFRLNTKKFTVYPWFMELWQSVVALVKRKRFQSLLSFVLLALVCHLCGFEYQITTAVLAFSAPTIFRQEKLHAKIRSNPTNS